MRRSATIRRRGFTIIELLVVIGIIVLLAGLLVSAIAKFQKVGPQLQAKNEMAQLGTAIENFKATYDVQYVPSALVLRTNYAPPYPTPANQDQVNANRAVADSLSYLKRVWPKASWTTGAPFPSGMPTSIELDGNQVLVFLLGGVPPADSRFTGSWAGTRLGFLNHATNPFNKGSTGVCSTPPNDRNKGPFYDFPANRVDTYAHFLDPYESPYYYFSSRNGNDYNYFGIYRPLLNPSNQANGFNTNGGYGGMNPFIGSDGKYMHPNGFQIVSAGDNKRPGPGGTYDPGVGAYGPAAHGGDDIANFHRGLLGSE